jgi:hypothetical protein
MTKLIGDWDGMVIAQGYFKEGGDSSPGKAK